MKRLLDILLVSLFLWLILPLIFLGSLLIFMFDGPPIFFRQHRVGRFGKDFQLIKFRTMTFQPEKSIASFDLGSTDRVTVIGSLFRRTKLDEVPQFWNVIRGDMSLVGPRPEVRKWVNIYPKRWEIVHRVRPGITDPASILYRNEEAILANSSDPEKSYREKVLPHKLSLYEKYVENMSFFGDLKILLQTFSALIK